jgi:hypothetical protein
MTDINQITLTPSQESAFEVLCDFCLNNTAQFITLEGFAGTGKTTVITKVVGEVGRQMAVALTAPMHKAKNVLYRMAQDSSAPVADIRTIYSMLGLKPSSDGEVREIIQGGLGRWDSIDIICLDESSQVNQALYKKIKAAAEKTKFSDRPLKFIFIGDALQLPPVGEEASLIFSEDDHRVLSLVEPTRFTEGNPIIELAQHLRECILSGGSMQPILQTHKGEDGTTGIYVLPASKFRAWQHQGFRSPQYESNPDLFRTVAWRNDTVRSYNTGIRKAIYGDTLTEPFMIGEKVLAAGPVMRMEPGGGLAVDAEIVMSTDAEGWIIGVEEMIHPFIPKEYGEFKVYRLEIGGGEAGAVDAYILHPDSERSFNSKLNDLSGRAKKERSLWRAFWGLHNMVADIRPAHAITAHRSQGSTYKNCFVDASDILANWNRIEALKCLYVACTRASDNLMIRVD